MNELIILISKINKYFLKMFNLIKKFFQPKKIILTRCACLGNDIISKIVIDKNIEIYNQQKSRVDTFIKTITSGNYPIEDEILNYMERIDVFPLIQQQNSIPWLKHIHSNKVKYFIMDSFSELVDQEFEFIKDGWIFNCVYSDINHDADFSLKFKANGLIDVEELKNAYNSFFQWVLYNNPNIIIIFINFPTKFDQRKQFNTREECIGKVIDEITKTNNKIISIKLIDTEIKKAPEDDFPYHLSRETIDKFYNEINHILMVNQC